MSRKLFQTPPDTPSEIQCRTLQIPSSKEWLGIINSALLLMVNQYEWEQVHETDLSIDETIAIIEPMIRSFWDTPDCGETIICTQPDGLPFFRLAASWHFEQFFAGEWIAPTGDYTVPPVPEREESTPDERRCAAAANAANVLKQVYEQVTDLAAEGAGVAEVILAVASFLTAEIGLWLGLAFAAFAPIMIALIGAFVAIAVYMTADLWDEAFNDLLKCLLYNCSSNDGDTVHFNIDCFNRDYAATVDLFSLDGLNQLRLFGQVSFMLSIIGADGLDAAGGTTEITDADCDDCIHCDDYSDTMLDGLGARTFLFDADHAWGQGTGSIPQQSGTLVAGDGISGGYALHCDIPAPSGQRAGGFYVDLGTVCSVESAAINYRALNNTGATLGALHIRFRDADGNVLVNRQLSVNRSTTWQSYSDHGTPSPIDGVRYVSYDIVTNFAAGGEALLCNPSVVVT